jgi:hypothetical protein
MTLTDLNLVIGAAFERYPLGVQEAVIRRTSKEPYIITHINIIREATQEEFIEYHKRERLEYSIHEAEYYYAFYID